MESIYYCARMSIFKMTSNMFQCIPINHYRHAIYGGWYITQIWGETLHDHILALREKVWANKTSLSLVKTIKP